ncbi:GtrA family protein [Aquirhabdus sp.]|uniref:GtrA family protein n=1 Tax=Aquirhabdus sp. TaxID=2824160 RepID=UPI00396CDBBE
MKKTLAFFFQPRFLKFLLAGGVAAAANYGSRFIFNIWVSYEQAIVLAYLVGMVVAFILMRRHVFYRQSHHLGPQIFKFIIVNILAVSQTLLISIALVRWVFPAISMTYAPEAAAHLIGVLVPAMTSYFGHRFFTFR